MNGHKWKICFLSTDSVPVGTNHYYHVNQKLSGCGLHMTGSWREGLKKKKNVSSVMLR